MVQAGLIALGLGGCQAALDIGRPEDAAPGRSDVGAPDGATPASDMMIRADASADGAVDREDAGVISPGCEDGDGDERGDGCPLGPDCDDGDDGIWPGAPETCDGRDEDCDGQVDEAFPGLGEACGVGLGACTARGRLVCSADGDGLTCDGQAGAPEEERCNERDDDCDGQVDEGVAQCCAPGEVRPCGTAVGACTTGQQACSPERAWGACSGRGPAQETCEGTDEDCDGQVDEGLLNACGACGAVPREQCNGQDDDCDGRSDEGVLNACGGCGAVPREQCNGEDDDCDGRSDEGVLNACGGCGAVPAEVCNGEDDDCDGRSDEGVANACGGCGPVPEDTCNGADDDCDGRADEGVANACGGCGDVPTEACNGNDDDCDGRTDEGLLNACGACGPVPREVCNRADDDCDGRTDEGVANACGACGAVPVEVCNQMDDDCDGAVDDGVCAPAVDACAEGAPVVLVGGAMWEGPIGGALSHYTCQIEGGPELGRGPERAFIVVGPLAGNYCISTEGSDFDTVLHQRGGCNVEAPSLSCDDDGGPGVTSQIQVRIPFLGVPAFVFVDSLNPNQGPGTIRIRSTLGACP